MSSNFSRGLLSNEEQVKQWCEQRRFGKFYESLMNLGVEDLNDLELTKMGMADLQRRRFFIESQNAAKIAENRSKILALLNNLPETCRLLGYSEVTLGEQLRKNYLNGEEPAANLSLVEEQPLPKPAPETPEVPIIPVIPPVPVGEDKEEEQPEGTLRVFPTSRQVFVDVSVKPETGASGRYLGSFTCEVLRDLRSRADNAIPEHCTLVIDPFLVPDGLEITQEQLDYGAFSGHPNAPMKGNERSRIIPLKGFEVSKTGNAIAPNFIDTGAQVVQMSFVEKDQPVADTPVQGTFTPSGTQERIKVEGNTTSQGQVEKVLPPGELSMICLTKSGNQLKVEPIITPRPYVQRVVDVPKPTIVNVISQSTVMALLQGSGPFLILGDRSGSMQRGKRIHNLKETMKSLFNESIKGNHRIAFAAWDDSTIFSRKSYHTSEKDREQLEKWIAALAPGGGTDMKQAIEKGVQQFPDAEDVYVLCDGDVGSFSRNGSFDVRIWTQFISAEPYKGKRFHLVAMEKDANDEDMQRMATAREPTGTFTSANKG